MRRHSFWVLLVFAGVTLLAFWLRMDDLATQPPGLNYDEARNYMRAWRIAEGYGLNWIFDDIPEPFDGIGRGVFFTVTGTSIFSARFLTVLLHTLATAATIGAARALYWRHSARDVIAVGAGLAFAVLPAAVMLGRTLYRANWVPTFTMLALMLITWAWRTRKRTYYIAAGVFVALSGMFYLAGLMFPPLIALFGLAYILNRRDIASVASHMVAASVALLTFAPWLYFYLRIDNWLGYRVGGASGETPPTPLEPRAFLDHVLAWTSQIYAPFDNYPEEGGFFVARYNVFTEPFLNPALLFCALIGTLYAIWRWRRGYPLVAGLLTIGLLIPALATTEMHATTRLVPLFAPLAILAGVGIGIIWHTLSRSRLRAVAIVGLAALFIGSAYNTYTAMDYHYHEEPLLFEEPLAEFGIDWNYNIRFRQLIERVAAADTPVYFPHHHLNNALGATFLRVSGFDIQGYSGEALPDGLVIFPTLADNNALFTSAPTGYVLLNPQTQRAIILPWPTDGSCYTEIAAQLRAEGTALYNSNRWLLGYALSTTEIDGCLSNFTMPPRIASPPLAVYDDTLELLHVDTPNTITTGEAFPATFYWRLRSDTNRDYFSFVQLVEDEIERRGGQSDTFSGIQRFLYPTSMWEVGEIVRDTRWVAVFPDAPERGYRLALGVHYHPNVQFADVETNYGARIRRDTIIVGQTWIKPDPFPPPPADAQPIDIAFKHSAGQIRLTHVEYDPPLDIVRPGDILNLQFFWHAETAIAEDYTLFVHLVNAAGETIAQVDTNFAETGFPTSTWYAGATISTTHQLAVPTDTSGPLRLRIGLYFLPTLERLEVTDSGGFAVEDNAVWLSDEMLAPAQP
jgi:hypothetical protein